MQTNPITLRQKRTVVLVSTILITFIYWIVALWYTNKTATSKDLVVFHALFGSLQQTGNLDLWQYIYQFEVTILLFVVLPWLITKYYLKEDFKKLCWGHPYSKVALIICAFAYPAVIASTWFSAQAPVLVAEYPLSKLIGGSWSVFVAYECAYFFYFFGYETFFRGYLQFGLRSEKPGVREIVAILIVQTLITTLFHTGKPGVEVLSAAALGPVIGFVALRFNSIWYGMLIHFFMNVFMDFFILRNLHLLPQSLF